MKFTGSKDERPRDAASGTRKMALKIGKDPLSSIPESSRGRLRTLMKRRGTMENNRGGLATASTKKAPVKGKDTQGIIGVSPRAMMKSSLTTEERGGRINPVSSKKETTMVRDRRKGTAGPSRNGANTITGSQDIHVVIVPSSDSSEGTGPTFGPTEMQPHNDHTVDIFGTPLPVANVIDIEICYPYKSYLELLEVDADWGHTRWIDIWTKAGYAYRVKMVKKANSYSLIDGWNLVAVCERLRVGQFVRFEYHDLYMVFSIRGQAEDTLKRGLAVAMPPDVQVSCSTRGVYRAEGVEFDLETKKAITYLRFLADVKNWRMYVCTIKKSQKNGSMYFSTQFSGLLPRNKETVALRFVDSPIVICGTIRRYGKACTKIMSGWKEFVAEHGIRDGDVLVFRFYKGPAVCEMFVCRV